MDNLENNVLNNEQTIEPVKNNKLLKAFKITYLIIYSLLTLFLILTYIDVMVNPSDMQNLGIALYLVIFVLIIGGIGYAVSLIFAVTGLVISIKKKVKKSTLAFYIVATVLPVVTELAFILLSHLSIV